MTKAQRQSGVTFIELVIALAIIAVAVTAVLLVYTTTVRNSADPMLREQSLAVAEAYMDEILSKHFTDPDGVDPEASRASYDDVSDYDGLSGSPSLPDGTSTGLSGYSVSVSVAADTLGGVGSPNTLKVVVSVTAPNSETVTLVGYRMNYE